MPIPRRNITISIGFLCVLLSLPEAQTHPPLGLEGFFQKQETPRDEVQHSENGVELLETAASFDASAETDSLGGASEIMVDGSSTSSPDFASAKIILNAVARGDDEVYGYFTTTTLSDGISGDNHQFVKGVSSAEIEAYGKDALLEKKFKGRTFLRGTETVSSQRTKSVAKGTSFASANSRVSITTEPSK